MNENVDEVKEDYKNNLMFEIDLKYIKKICNNFKIPPKKVDCYPLLWFQLDTRISEEWAV